MYLISVLSFSCVILSVTCAPQRHWADDVEDSPRPYWLSSRRSAYPPMTVYGSFGDEMTRMLDDLQRSLLAAQVGPQFPVSSGRIPVFGISTSTSDDSEEDDSVAVGPSVSIGGSALGTGFGSLFGNFGGFDTKNLKNKTTVKTEVIDGHKVTVKESTFVSDTDGFKSVIHLSEVDLADSSESEEGKPSTAKPSDASPEDKDDKDKESGEKGDDDKDKEGEGKDEGKDKESGEGKDEKPEQPKSDEESTTPEAKPTEPSKNDEENETDSRSSDENRINTRHPDSEVEELDAGNDYYNYRYNTVGKVKAQEDDWTDNKIDSTLSRTRRHASRVVNHPPVPVPNLDDYMWYPWRKASERRHRRDMTVSGGAARPSRDTGRIGNLHDGSGRIGNLQGDTRVNQILSEKQQSSGLYSIDPDAELLDADNYYEVEGHRPGSQQKVVFYKQKPNSAPTQGNYHQQRPYGQLQQARPPRYNSGEVQLPLAGDYQTSPQYQRNVPVRSENYQRNIPVNAEDYQRNIPVNAEGYQRNFPVNAEGYQRNFPANAENHRIPASCGQFQRNVPVVSDDYQKALPVNQFQEAVPHNNYQKSDNYQLPVNSARGDLISPLADDYQRSDNYQSTVLGEI